MSSECPSPVFGVEPPIGVNDLHIAGHARSAGLVLVTNNVSEFARVPALEVENWVADGESAIDFYADFETC